VIINRPKGTQHPQEMYTKEYTTKEGYKVKVVVGKWPNDGPIPKADYEPVVYVTDPSGKTHAVARSHWGLTYFENIKPHKGDPENFSPFYPNSWHTPYFEADNVDMPNASLHQKATFMLAKLDHRTSSPTPLYKELVAKADIKDLPPEGLEVRGFVEAVSAQAKAIHDKAETDLSAKERERERIYTDSASKAAELAAEYASRGEDPEKVSAKLRAKFGLSEVHSTGIVNAVYGGEQQAAMFTRIARKREEKREKLERQAAKLTTAISTAMEAEHQKIGEESTGQESKRLLSELGELETRHQTEKREEAQILLRQLEERKRHKP